MAFDPHRFETIDWDDEEDPDGNLHHCLRHGVDEQVVAEVLRSHPVEVKMRLQSADFAIVGPNEHQTRMRTILFDVSYKRGDWLRPIPGWRSKHSEVNAWIKATGIDWRRS